MSFFFYAIIAFMVLLLPISIGLEGAYSHDRHSAFFIIKLFGFKIVTIKVYFNEKDGAYLSVNGKPGKKIGEKGPKKKKKRRKIDFFALLSAFYLSKTDVDVHVGGETQSISLLLGSIRIIIDDVLAFFNARRPIDEARVRVLPCFTAEPITVKFSITLMTSPALILSALAHTIFGEKYAKPSDRKLNG